MAHRFTPALLCILILAAVPATAAAQAPPDERANARAFADVGIRLTDEVNAALAGLDGAVFDDCKSVRRLARGTDRQQTKAFTLITAHLMGIMGRAVTPALDRATADLNAIETADPALQGGRTAWVSISRLYSVAATFPHVRICRELRKYVRHGFRSTRAMRRANKMFRRINRFDVDALDAKLTAAADRLVELGVSEADAAKFAGESDDNQAEYSGARAAQAPAPSSPLKLLRAAS